MTEQERKEWEDFYATRKSGIPKEIDVAKAKKQLEDLGLMKTTEFGWVYPNKLQELIKLGAIKSIDGDFILTYEGVKKYDTGSLFKFLQGQVKELKLNPTKEKKDKDQDKEIEDIWKGLESDT